MQDKGLKLLGIVGCISMQAGTLVGTTAAFGKKGAGFGARGMTAMVDLFRRPAKGPAMIEEGESGLTSESPALGQSMEHTTAQENSPSIPVATLECDHVTARHNLIKMPSEAGKTQSQLESQLEDILAKKESLVSDLKKSHDDANEVKTRKNTSQAQMAALESDLTSTRHKLEKLRSREEDNNSQMSDVSSVKTQAETVLSNQRKHKATAVVPISEEITSSMEVRIADQKPRSLTAEDKLSSPPAVVLEQVNAAVFASAAEKIIFTMAFSDIVSQDAAVRADAARLLAGIHHKLSARTLVAQTQMACEPSPLVRRECIKALTALKAKEGIPAVERALADQDASVRLTAVWGLYHLAGAASISKLIPMFSDENEDVRRRAVTCMSWLGQKDSAVEMLPLLDDNSASVRQAAVEAMANLRSQQVVHVLIGYLNDPDESFRKVVLDAIETITDKKMGEPFPADETSLKRLIARWREWWRDEQPK